MNTMLIQNISFPRANRRRQITTSSGNKIPGSNSVGTKVSWGQRQRQGKDDCDLNHNRNGNSEKEDDDDDNEGTASTEFTFDDDDDSTTPLHISDAAFSSTADPTISIAAADHHHLIPSSTTTTKATSSSASTREHNTLNNTKKTRQRHRVHFGSIEIHEHTIQLGGDGIPSTSGPSLSLSWEEQGPSTTIASVIEYEEARPLGYVPRKGTEMYQPRTQRIDLLLSVGYTYREIVECTNECETIRTQRLQTKQQLQLSTFFINILRGKIIRNKFLLREKKNKKRN